MMNTSESTIERWLNLLEKKSHISRDTTTTPHKNSDITKAKKFEWSKDRKIYICKGFSNNFTDTVKNNGYNEPVKITGIRVNLLIIKNYVVIETQMCQKRNPRIKK